LGSILVTVLLASAVLHKLRPSESIDSSWHIARAAIQSRLESTPERHLIFVQYSTTHSPFEEWVYNAADIDNSPVVWAQSLNANSDAALIRYFAGRKVWLLQADTLNRALTPFVP
jgi:hypothetical protein